MYFFSIIYLYNIIYNKIYYTVYYNMGFLGGSDDKEFTCNVGEPGSISGSLEKGMATHSSILAWRIPWTEEPGGL